MGEKEEKQQKKNCKSCSHKWESDQSVPSAPDSCLAEPQNVSFVHFSAAYLKFNLTKCDRDLRLTHTSSEWTCAARGQDLWKICSPPKHNISIL